MCVYDVDELVLLRRFQLSKNHALDGVLDQLNSSKVTDAGPLELLDTAEDDDDMDVLAPATVGSAAGAFDLPGARSHPGCSLVLITTLWYSDSGDDSITDDLASLLCECCHCEKDVCVAVRVICLACTLPGLHGYASLVYTQSRSAFCTSHLSFAAAVSTGPVGRPLQALSLLAHTPRVSTPGWRRAYTSPPRPIRIADITSPIDVADITL